MTLYTPMPLELVLEGWSDGQEPMIEVEYGTLRMLLTPVAPGVGKLVRLVSAPLDTYLLPAFEPGKLIYFGAASSNMVTGTPSIDDGERGL
ncbi:YlzJ-like family protein [Cohnella hashimotonis]|uniref:YlzJ-like family protein n=1 Tax=Cohnella hashimotonis TaxID=2826895 RepID=A0ABT6TIK1_9BACL|nr:YlzJ-like family protein [Cohnella hashimotonis]MDI4646150.1 YlzJ-like family protein [Cohnella hashimotonis]